MTTRRWGHFVTWAKTARSWRIPVTVLLGFRADTGRWLEQDRVMALALQQYEDSIHSCGVPSSIGFGDDNVGRVEWKETICHACEAKEAAHNDNKNNQYPGQLFYPVWDAE